MRIGITGASGFIGRRLARVAARAGHEVIGFSRVEREASPPIVEWRRVGADRAPELGGIDALIHLAGESIFGLWTPAKRSRIVSSRVEGTRRIVDGIAAAGADRPRALVCASGVHYYGDTGDRTVAEDAPGGAGFLADVCRAWEGAAIQAESLGVAVARVRLGLVIGPGGGAMRLMLPLFKAGLGGPLGNGRQWMSCIHIDDAAGIMLHVAGARTEAGGRAEPVAGAFNAVLPAPVRNADFTRELAAVVRRPAVIPAPAFALRTVRGEMSSMMLFSVRALPRRTTEAGYAHRFADLRAALRDAAAPRRP